MIERGSLTRDLVNLTNVLWVEQPVGTGFSIGEVTATSEEDIAKDLYVIFLSTFYFPDYFQF